MTDIKQILKLIDQINQDCKKVLAKVDVSEMMGSSVHLHVTAEGKDVIVIVPTTGGSIAYPMGSELNLTFNGNVAHVFDKETGMNLEW